MSGSDKPEPWSESRFAASIGDFARILRRAGLPVGPDKVVEAVEAVDTVGITDRRDFYWALRAVLANGRAQMAIFDQAFQVFWCDPRLLERLLSLRLPKLGTPAHDDQAEVPHRLFQALNQHRHPDLEHGEPEASHGRDLAFTYSHREILQQKDFEKMSVAEMEEAKQAVRNLQLNLKAMPTRRFLPDARRGSRVDPRASLRASLRTGGDVIPLLWKRRRRRRAPLVLLCDISGSMECYSRMLLHFAHALAAEQERVYVFVFGTRLTSVTHCLRRKDVDGVMAEISSCVQDWSGGTRIHHCLHRFNRLWSRQVLGCGAVVLLITDGLDRDAADRLGQEVERLRKSCRCLIWLNPLLRYHKFEPRAQGIRAILPHVDELRSAHNLQSLVELGEVLTENGGRRAEGVRAWQRSL